MTPPWGSRRLSDMTDDELLDALLADCPAYMAQARAEHQVDAEDYVRQEIDRAMQQRRETARKRPWWTWPAAWMRGDL